MPLKNNQLPPYCINHPDERMLVLNDKDPGVATILLLAREGPDHVFTTGARCIVAHCYGCLICGYTEAYLPDFELEDLRKSIDFLEKTV